MASGPITSWQIEGDKVEALTDFNFLVYKITADSDSICDIKMRLFLGKPRQHMKKQRHHFANKGAYSQSYSLSSSPERMWKLDHEEDWAFKNWCFQIVVLENTLESPLGCKEIKLIHGKDKCWSWSSNTLATLCEEPTHWKRHCYWEILKRK